MSAWKETDDEQQDGRSAASEWDTATVSCKVADKWFKSTANLTKWWTSEWENNGLKWSEREPVTLQPGSQSYLILQVPNAACPAPGYAPQPPSSQASWVHISEEDKVSKEVTSADLLSSVGDTMNQNCGSAAWPSSWLSSCLLGERADKKKKKWCNKRRHSSLSSLPDYVNTQVLTEQVCIDYSHFSAASSDLFQI